MSKSTMILLKHGDLATKLHSNVLPEKEKTLYFYSLALYGVLISLLGFNMGLYEAVTLALLILLPIGIYYALNKKGDNKGFLERLCILSIPASLKALGIFGGLFMFFRISVALKLGNVFPIFFPRDIEVVPLLSLIPAAAAFNIYMADSFLIASGLKNPGT